jgi:hypothetical protein
MIFCNSWMMGSLTNAQKNHSISRIELRSDWSSRMPPKNPRLYVARTKNKDPSAEPEWEFAIASYSTKKFCNKICLTTSLSPATNTFVRNYQNVPVTVSQTSNYVVIVCVAKIQDYDRFYSILKTQSTPQKIRVISSRIWVQGILNALNEDLGALGKNVTDWGTVGPKTVDFMKRMIQKETDLTSGGSVPLCDLLTGHEIPFHNP